MCFNYCYQEGWLVTCIEETSSAGDLVLLVFVEYMQLALSVMVLII